MSLLCCCFGWRDEDPGKTSRQVKLLEILKDVRKLWPNDTIAVGLLETNENGKIFNLDEGEEPVAAGFHLLTTYSAGDEDFQAEITFTETQNDAISNLINKISKFVTPLSPGSDVQVHIVGKDAVFSCLTVDQYHLLAVWVEKYDEEEKSHGSEGKGKDKGRGGTHINMDISESSEKKKSSSSSNEGLKSKEDKNRNRIDDRGGIGGDSEDFDLNFSKNFKEKKEGLKLISRDLAKVLQGDEIT